MQPIPMRRCEAVQIDIASVEGAPVTGRVSAQTLLRGENAMLLEFRMDRGAIIPAHQHDHECYLYVLRGRLRSTIGGQDFDLGPGDIILHPAGIEHSSEALEDSTWVEVKTPPPKNRWYRSLEGG